jgi:hypothetical protein
MLALLAACGTSPPASPPADALPPGVPTGAVAVRLAGADLTADGKPVEPWQQLDRAPTDEDEPALATALAAAKEAPILVDLPGDTPFWKVRKILGSIRTAGAGPAFLAVAGSGEAFPLAQAPRFGLGGVCDAPLPVSGAEPLVTVSLQTGTDGAWVVATGRFLPVLPSGPTEGYPTSCLAVPACDALFPDGPLRTACASPTARAPERVALAGETGCLLPIAKTPDQVARWRAELPGVLGRLGLGKRPLLLVMPEARTRLDALLAVLGGFRDAGLPVPSVGATLLVEGNDGPPVCNAEVRDEAALGAAGARWLGSLRYPAEPADGG